MKYNHLYKIIFLCCFIQLGKGCVNSNNHPIIKNTNTTSNNALRKKEKLEFERILNIQKSKQWVSAKKNWEALIKKGVKSPYIYINLSIVNKKINDLDGAKNNIKKAIKIAPNNHYAWQQLGIIERKQGSFKDAEKSYNTAIKINPNDYISHINLGVLYDKYLGEPQKAASHFKKAQTANEKAKKIVTPWLKEIEVRPKNAI